VAKHRRYAIIMAGGSGTRFWPWSREDRPKQLLSLTSKRSMLVETVARLRGYVPPSNVFLVTGRRHQRQVLEQLPSLDPRQVLAEPEGRNTAACIGWAALEILERCPDAVTSVLSADHLIADADAFRADLARASAVADSRRVLVTFGVKPAYPATGYGYVRAGKTLAGLRGVHEVAAFVEKPKLALARRYVAAGNYYWNSGIFVWRADTIREELATWLPELLRGLEEMNGKRRRGVLPVEVLDRAYPRLPSISIDYGVLEKSRRVAVVAASFPWTDIGSWDALAEQWPADADGNATQGAVLAIEARSNIVASRDRPIVLLGVDNLVVVDAGDALMVCPRERCQDVKTIVARLGDAGLGRLK
jgi:mannose-1-phosphate guanylyltransferase